MDRGSARLVRKKRAFAQHGSRPDQRHPDARFFIFMVNTQAAAFDEIQRAVLRALLYQHLAAVQGKGLHVRAQNIPMRLAELAAQRVAGAAMRDGLRQTLNIELGGGGQWSVHGGAKIPARAQGGKDC